MYCKIKGVKAVMVIIIQMVTLILKLAWGRLPIDEICKDFCQCDTIFLRVDCANEGLDHIPTAIRNNTRILIFDNNKLDLIEHSDFAGMKNLRSLSLVNNSIDEIEGNSFRNQKRISVLDLSRNRLGEVPTALGHIKQLKVLDLSNNQIRTLSKEPWCNLTRLQRLQLDQNGVQNLPFVMTSKLNELIELSVSHNNISDIPVGQFINMSNLEYLDLSYNNINTELQSVNEFSARYGYEFPTTATDLEYAVDDFAEGITYGSFKGLTGLRVLNLKGNNIQEFVAGVLNDLANLYTLHLDQNKMAWIDEDAFRFLFHLHFLSLSNNKLSDLPFMIFQDLRDLEVLILDGNRIHDLAPITNLHFFRLRKLSLNRNRIRTIDPPGFRLYQQIEKIYMNHNRLTEMPIVQNLTNLTIFDVGDNRIRTISPINAFEGTSLRELYLGNNRFETIHKNTFAYLPNLKLLDVSGNNYICDCQLNWLSDFYDAYDWMNTPDGQTLDQVVRCKSPLIMKELSIYDRAYLELPDKCTEYIEPYNVMVLVASWGGVVAFFLLVFWTYIYFDFKRRFYIRKPSRRFLLVNVKNEITGLPYHTTEQNKVRFRSCESDTESLDMLNNDFDEETTV